MLIYADYYKRLLRDARAVCEHPEDRGVFWFSVMEPAFHGCKECAARKQREHGGVWHWRAAPTAETADRRVA